MTHPLQLFRESRQWTQQFLAEKLGCSQTLVALVESGKRSVSKARAEKWESVTGIPRLTLMFPDEYPVRQPEVVPGATAERP